jgi:hypothetical protein
MLDSSQPQKSGSFAFLTKKPVEKDFWEGTLQSE